jgi:hypothetical protein
MRFINSWNTYGKQADKFIIKLRFGKLTLFEFISDISAKKLRIVFINFGVEF